MINKAIIFLSFYQNIKNFYTSIQLERLYRTESKLSWYFCIRQRKPSRKGPTLKGKNLLVVELILSFKSRAKVEQISEHGGIIENNRITSPESALLHLKIIEARFNSVAEQRRP